MPWGVVSTSAGDRHGPQISASEAPNSTTAGTPKAAAICAGPESLPTNKDADAKSDLIAESGVPCTVRNSRNGVKSSAAPPITTTLHPEAANLRATSTNRSGGHAFPALVANG